jgi:CRISPR system Cascade subunit CasA
MPETKPYNLLGERWIPVRYQSGETRSIAPHQITEAWTDDDGVGHGLPKDLAAERPDFNGALIQFLIGLVQTTCPPKTERAWRKRFKSPPSSEELRDHFEPYRPAFDLDGDGPRFMQDFGQAEVRSESDEKPIHTMLLSAPGEDAIKKSQDHFVRERTDELSRAEAALALFVYQTNVPHTAAGAGFKNHSALRGACPATCVVLGGTLWETIWLNVLDAKTFETFGGRMGDELSDRFPWLSHHSSLEQEVVGRGNVHASHVYWGMPQRILLEFEGGECKTFRRRRNGIDYLHPWTHPLTPARSLDAATLTYRGWTTLAADDSAALTTRAYLKRAEAYGLPRTARLWAFGYENTKAKIDAYHDARLPLFVVPARAQQAFDWFVEDLVAGASEAAGSDGLAQSLRRALLGTFKKKDGKLQWDLPKSTKDATTKSIIADARAAFWRNTEADFYTTLRNAAEDLNEGRDEALVSLRAQWYERIREEALAIFDEATAYGTARQGDPRSIARARIDLHSHFRDKVLKAVGLAQEQLRAYRAEKYSDGGDDD